ncbi:hypothetical protein OKA04_12185 [Luteolibacter flavescens]|uniref:Uncharacterized protein n=1 Tax=Luteolibacter flavescens TaxID=1859460 RepID=A0ABT3FPK1_9BACT|nr:hypothetical protein [Luteolibacter flavescens]MCW1885489.1 hypothetical protein [Luteolibacter flavescens]
MKCYVIVILTRGPPILTAFPKNSAGIFRAADIFEGASTAHEKGPDFSGP